MADKLLLNRNIIKKESNNNGYPGRSITETIINGFFTVDRKWTVKYWNKAAEKILKIQAKDIVGKNFWEVFVDVIPLDFYAVYHKAFLQDIPVHFEEYWGEMGAWFDVITYHCDDTLSVSFKSSNQSLDPEYPRHPERQLEVIAQLYRFVTEVTNDCLWEWDFQTKEIFWIDGGHKRMFGYQIENALIPQSFWESCIHPDDKVRVLARINKIITEDSGDSWEEEYRFKKANGDYVYVHDRGHIIYNEEEHTSRMIGATQDITEKILLKNKLVQEGVKRQREITNAVLTSLEKERASIGKELHDNLGQLLALAKLYIQMSKTYEKNREEYLDKSCGFIVNVIDEIRKIAKALVIPGVHIIGLFDNVKNLINDLAEVHSIKIEFEMNDTIEKDLDENLQLTIFRIVQEQVNNILNHSGATHATINLSRLEDQVTLIISDDGKGCDTSKDKKGVGLINIKGRAELYNGNVTITSNPGEGFQLKVVLLSDSKINKPEIVQSIPAMGNTNSLPSYRFSQ